ncbi:hypothetical protein T484DRAFT_1876577, partial [Baffinella frigidus]
AVWSGAAACGEWVLRGAEALAATGRRDVRDPCYDAVGRGGRPGTGDEPREHVGRHPGAPGQLHPADRRVVPHLAERVHQPQEHRLLRRPVRPAHQPRQVHQGVHPRSLPLVSAPRSSRGRK